jgi:hypothetical protein
MKSLTAGTASRAEDCSVITALCVNLKMPLVAFLAALQRHADSGCAKCAEIARTDELLELEADAPCTCRQSDADLFDAVGCDYHDPNSPWNVRLRAVTAVQQYEINQKEPRANADDWAKEEVNYAADQKREGRPFLEGLSDALGKVEVVDRYALPTDDQLTIGHIKSPAATLRNLKRRMDAA